MLLAVQNEPLRYFRQSTQLESVRRDTVQLREAQASLEITPIPVPLVALELASDEGNFRYELIGGAIWFEALMRKHRDDFEQTVPCHIVQIGSATYKHLKGIPAEPREWLELAKVINAMHHAGESLSYIAQLFRFQLTQIKRFLSACTVAPTIQDAYTKGRITSEQLIAFTLTEDHCLQNEILESGNLDPWHIRRMLITESVRADIDPRFPFVGETAYKAAGGALTSTNAVLWILDPPLLERLAMEKLKHACEGLAIEGWGWIEQHTSFGFQERARFGSAPIVDRELSEGERLARSDLQNAIRAANDKYDEALKKDDADQVLSVESLLASLQESLEVLDLSFATVPVALRSCSGVIATITPTGELEVLKGLVRPEDIKTLQAGQCLQGVPSNSGFDSQINLHLFNQLKAEHIAVIQETLAATPSIALRFLAFILAQQLFAGSHGSSLQIHLENRRTDLKEALRAAAECKAWRLFEERTQDWRSKLPLGHEEMWQAILCLDDGDLNKLLAHCIATSIDVRGSESFSKSQIEVRPGLRFFSPKPT